MTLRARMGRFFEETVYGTTVLEQRRIFHKLRNVADKCREELKGEAKKETRKQPMEQTIAFDFLNLDP